MISAPHKVHDKVKRQFFIDPLDRPTISAGRNNCFRTCRPSVRPPHFSKSGKIKQSENNVRYWRDCGSGRVDH